MKKALGFILTVMLVFSLSACDIAETDVSSVTSSDSVISTDGSESAADNDNGLLKDNFPSYEEVQEQYPNKTVIVWAFPQYRYDVLEPLCVREVNAYLDETGCDLAVCFEPIDAPVGVSPDPFIAAVKDKLDSGGRIDIISPMNYGEFVFAGLYERLDDYLTAESELYRAFPEKLWESLRINGGIYGVNGSVSYTLSHDRGYYVNSELAEKYAFDVSKPIIEQLDILKKVKANENCDVFSAYVPGANSAFLCADIKEMVTGVYWNETTHSAECVLDNRDYVETIRLYNEMNNNRLLVNNGVGGGSFFIKQDSVPGSTVYNGTETVDIQSGASVVNAVPVFNSPTSIRNCRVATGICSASENKSAAFELLSLVYIDPYLNNLLTFGIEGEDYSIVDGMVDTVINPFNTTRFANDFICHRYYNSPFTPEQYTEVYENALLHEDSDFTFDVSVLAEEVSAVTDIFSNFELIPAYKNGEERVRNADDTIAELRKQLEEAGLQKIIDECNRQYEVYKNEKS